MHDTVRHVLEEEILNNQDKYSQYERDDQHVRAFCQISSSDVTIHQVGLPPQEFKAVENPSMRVELIKIGLTHYDLLTPKSLPIAHHTEVPHKRLQEESVVEQEAVTDAESEAEHKKTEQITTPSNHQSLSREEAERKVLESETVIAHQKTFDDKTTLTKLLQTVLLNRKSTMQWLISKGMMTSNRKCPDCNSELRFRPTLSDREDGEFWCASCRKRFSIRSDSLISSLRLSPQKFTQVLILWLKGAEHCDIAKEVGVSVRTVSRYTEKLLVASVILLQQHSRKLGGPMRIVEVDECLLSRRKYGRGRRKDQYWVLGGVERPRHPDEQPGMFLVSIPDRTRETLESMIQRWILPQTIIITDSFKSYQHLEELGYYHFEVNHSKNFVSPESGAHTQRIEGMWRWLRTHCSEGGSGYPDLDFRLAAFLYRRCINQDIETFIADLGKVSHSEVMRLISERRYIRDHLDTASTDDESTSTSTTRSERASSPEQDSSDRRRRLVVDTLISSPTRKRRIRYVPDHFDRSLEEEEDETERSSSDKLVEFDALSHIRTSIKERQKRGRNPGRRAKKGRPRSPSRSISVKRRFQRELKNLKE